MMSPVKHARTVIRTTAMLAALVVVVGQANATTWNEPWHREVVSSASAFGLYKVRQSGPGALTLERVRQIAGEDTGPTIEVTSFYALKLTSSSHTLQFGLGSDTAYFHLKRVGQAWAIATPTSGFADVEDDGLVRATYRFSAHQALIEADVYESTQACIFARLHGKRTCDPGVARFIEQELSKPAEGIGENSTVASRQVFFRQHAALETAGYMAYPLPDALLERFLSKQDRHVQISALRALAAGQSPDKAERLMRFVRDEKPALVARIVAVLLLKEIGAREMKQQLLEYAPQASRKPADLGMGIMDPRVGTNFPSSLQQAVQVVAEQL